MLERDSFVVLNYVFNFRLIKNALMPLNIAFVIYKNRYYRAPVHVFQRKITRPKEIIIRIAMLHMGVTYISFFLKVR